MNILFWGIFYIIVTSILSYFFIKEKKVMDYIKLNEDKILKKIDLNATSKQRLNGTIITVIALVITALFFVFVDKKPDQLIKIKNIAIYAIFILNLAIYSLRREHEYIFLINLVMMFLGSLMFNIQDKVFYMYLMVNLPISVLLIYLFRKPTDEKYIGEEEKRKKSSIGKALSRITTTILAIILVGTIQQFYIGNYVIPSGSMEPTILVQDRVFSNMVKYKFIKPKVGDIIAFKEPVNNRVMYTKRITGTYGNTLQIIDRRLHENDNLSENLNRPYKPEGLFYTNKIYIPKKGDKVKLDKIIVIEKLVGQTEDGELIVGTNYTGYNNGEYYEELTGDQFLNLIKTNKDYKNIVVNERVFEPEDPTKKLFYTFTLKVEGRDELVLPILDLRDDDSKFNKLLSGQSITLDQNYYMAMGDNTRNSYDSRYFGYIGEKRIKGELVLRWWPLNRMGLL